MAFVALDKCAYSRGNGALRPLMTVVERGVDHVDTALKGFADGLRVPASVASSMAPR